MLHYVYELVANFVCLVFGARQIVYSGFLDLIQWKQLPAGNDTDGSGSEPKQ